MLHHRFSNAAGYFLIIPDGRRPERFPQRQILVPFGHLAHHAIPLDLQVVIGRDTGFEGYQTVENLERRRRQGATQAFLLVHEIHGFMGMIAQDERRIPDTRQLVVFLPVGFFVNAGFAAGGQGDNRQDAKQQTVHSKKAFPEGVRKYTRRACAVYFCAVRIHTENLVKRYGKRTVVNHVSFEVAQGEIVGLLGPNGAGKTTSFYQVVGLIKPDEGNVFLDGVNITKLPMYKRAQLGIGYLPQEASVFRKLSVEDNIGAVLEMTKMTRAEQLKKRDALLEEFRLTHVRKSPGDVLSGGERRRTEIARALSVDPKFILLDEPFAGIDPIAVEDIQIIVAKLKFKNIGILITDHNVQETLSITDRAYLLFEGKILKAGTAEELASDEQVRKVYLGQQFELKRKVLNF